MAQQRVPRTTLPEPGSQSEQDHARISRRFQEHTALEIQKGNRLQASEKIWAQVAHALKAVAEDRGWAHGSHALLGDIAVQIGREQGQRTEYIRHLSLANSMHANFYENEADWDHIEVARKDAAAFVAKLRADRNRRPSSFTIRDANDQRRLSRLLGVSLPRNPAAAQRALDRRFPRGMRSAQGFAPKYGYGGTVGAQRRSSTPAPKLRQSPGMGPMPNITVRRR